MQIILFSQHSMFGNYTHQGQTFSIRVRIMANVDVKFHYLYTLSCWEVIHMINSLCASWRQCPLYGCRRGDWKNNEQEAVPGWIPPQEDRNRIPPCINTDSSEIAPIIGRRTLLPWHPDDPATPRRSTDNQRDGHSDGKNWSLRFQPTGQAHHAKTIHHCRWTS